MRLRYDFLHHRPLIRTATEEDPTCSSMIPSLMRLRLHPRLELPSPGSLMSSSPLITSSPILTTKPLRASLRVELRASVEPPSCGSSKAIHSVRPSCAESNGCLKIVSINHTSSRFYTAIRKKGTMLGLGNVRKPPLRASQCLRDSLVASSSCYSSFNHLPSVSCHDGSS